MCKFDARSNNNTRTSINAVYKIENSTLVEVFEVMNVSVRISNVSVKKIGRLKKREF